MGLLRLEYQPRRPSVLRPTPRHRRPAPPSVARTGQPTRRHPARLSTPPRHLQRRHPLGTSPNHPSRLTSYDPGMSTAAPLVESHASRRNLTTDGGPMAHPPSRLRRTGSRAEFDWERGCLEIPVMGLQGRVRCAWGWALGGVMTRTASASSSRASARRVGHRRRRRILCTTPCCASGDQPGYLELLSSPVALIRLIDRRWPAHPQV